jgi:hypothetical protein
MESAVIQKAFQRSESFLFNAANWKPVLLAREWGEWAKSQPYQEKRVQAVRPRA